MGTLQYCFCIIFFLRNTDFKRPQMNFCQFFGIWDDTKLFLYFFFITFPNCICLHKNILGTVKEVSKKVHIYFFENVSNKRNDVI